MSEWQWHQLGSTQVCTSLQTDNHAKTPLHSFLQARCPFCRKHWRKRNNSKCRWFHDHTHTHTQWVAVTSAGPAMCKSAPCSRHITTPAPHHSSFLRAGCPSCHPTNSIKALKAGFHDHCRHNQITLIRQHARFTYFLVNPLHVVHEIRQLADHYVTVNVSQYTVVVALSTGCLQQCLPHLVCVVRWPRFTPEA